LPVLQPSSALPAVRIAVAGAGAVWPRRNPSPSAGRAFKAVGTCSAVPTGLRPGSAPRIPGGITTAFRPRRRRSATASLKPSSGRNAPCCPDPRRRRTHTAEPRRRRVAGL